MLNHLSNFDKNTELSMSYELDSEQIEQPKHITSTIPFIPINEIGGEWIQHDKQHSHVCIKSFPHEYPCRFSNTISHTSNESLLTPVWKIRPLTDTAHVPQKGTKGSAGYDLYADEDAEITPWSRQLVSTGISSAIPEGHYGRILSRSSLALKHSIDIGAGVIDSDYRGEIKVLLINSSNEPYRVSQGDRIAQMVIQKVESPHIITVDVLDETERKGGFGSTGKR